MSTLYEISAEMRAIEARLLADEGEITDADFADWIDATVEARNRKIDNYAALLREIEFRIAGRLAEAERLSDLVKADQRLHTQLKERLQWFFETHRIEGEIQTERFRFKLVTNGGKAPLVIADGVTPAQVDAAFRREIPASAEFATDAIRRALDAGEPLTWARYGARSRRLSIK